MAIKVNDLFNPQRMEITENSREWYTRIFERAYCERNGVFEKVRQRLEQRYSVLVYVPGNCMSAAADYVKNHINSGDDWQEFGEYSKGFQTYEEMWQKTQDALTTLQRWFKPDAILSARHIFHNLNLLTDDQGHILTHPWAQQAMFALVESTRKAGVLGLTDRETGELPPAMIGMFYEKVRLGDIPLENFRLLIPVEFSRRFYGGRDIPDGVGWLLWSRLRSSDPIRAVAIMRQISEQHDLTLAMQKITELTPSAEFVSPDQVFTGDPDNIVGFEPATRRQLENIIVTPYKTWRRHIEDATDDDYGALFKRLPPGLILYGPPGTGKTYLARWIAGSIGLPLRIVKGAEIRAREFGQAEKNVHRLFAEVRRASPCVLVMDDADDIFTDREAASGSVASAERAIVNAALQEMDGVFGALDGVLMIMTTNRFKAIDQAIKARLPWHFRIPYPLDTVQVQAIVQQIGDEYQLRLTADVKEILVDRFMKPLKSGVPVKRNRQIADKGYFATRDILNAMRWLGSLGTGIPTNTDLQDMLDYYDRSERGSASNAPDS